MEGIMPEMMRQFEKDFGPWEMLECSGELELDYTDMMDEAEREIPDPPAGDPRNPAELYRMKWLFRIAALHSRISDELDSYRELMAAPALSRMQVYLGGAIGKLLEAVKTNPAVWIFTGCLIVALAFCRAVGIMRWNFIGFRHGFIGNILVMALLVLAVSFVKYFLLSVTENSGEYRQFRELRINRAEENLETIGALEHDLERVKELADAFQGEPRLAEEYYPYAKELWRYFCTGRADTLKEALSLLEDERFRRKIEQLGMPKKA